MWVFRIGKKFSKINLRNFGSTNDRIPMNLDCLKDLDFINQVATDSLPIDFNFSIKGTCSNFYTLMQVR